MVDKYFLKANWQDDWQEVTKEMWIKAERAAGFRPKCAYGDPEYMTTCATASFSNNTISGKIEYDIEEE